MKLNVKLPPIYVTPSHRTFTAGNTAAKAENMSADSHMRRMAGLHKAWAESSKQYHVKRTMTKSRISHKETRVRVRLKQTVAKEAREIQELARRNAEAVITRMAEIAQTSFNETAAIAAAQVVLERAYGKANQTNINASIDANGKATDVSGKELDKRVEQTLKRIEELTGRTPKAPESKERSVDLRELDRDPDSSSFH